MEEWKWKFYHLSIKILLINKIWIQTSHPHFHRYYSFSYNYSTSLWIIPCAKCLHIIEMKIVLISITKCKMSLLRKNNEKCSLAIASLAKSLIENHQKFYRSISLNISSIFDFRFHWNSIEIYMQWYLFRHYQKKNVFHMH